MCIVAIAWQLFDELPFVLLSNRDEFYDRPTTPAHQWLDAPIFAGRDDRSGGTWLGYQQQTQKTLDDETIANKTIDVETIANKTIDVETIDVETIESKPIEGKKIENKKAVTQNGRWAAVLNFRDGVQARADQRSRGKLVTQFLMSDLSPLAFARQLELQAYAGFNLIVGDARQAVVVNNRGYPATPLPSGLHILSNGQPDSAWFKSERLRGRVRQEVLPLINESLAFHNGNSDYWQPAAWNVLSDTVQAENEQLPNTGVSPVTEQALSAICIDTPELPNYGTRTQSIMTMTTPVSDSNVKLNTDKADIKKQPTLALESREYHSRQ